MNARYRPHLERLRYWPGQTLQAGDDRDQARADAWRRQLHNRALHATGGVAWGLRVSEPSAAPGSVEVAEGAAYDARGRELVLRHARRLALPAQAGVQVLRLRHAPDAADRVLLAWGSPATFDRASEAMVARCIDGVLQRAFVPPQARPIARARLATGATVQGNTPWEAWVLERPDGGGGIDSPVVGVQTRIDTSASGFTKLPCYVASVQAEQWDLGRAEFAPAYFPHVTDATVDGFTLRLLMTEIARRRYQAWDGSGLVAATERQPGDRLAIRMGAGAAFKPGDVIAQLRPRARAAVAIAAIDGDTLALAAPLGGVAAGDRLAFGNLPRVARVDAVLADDPTVLATFTAVGVVKKGDVLLRVADGELAVIDKVAAGQATVGNPFPGWLAGDVLQIARRASAADVTNRSLSADGTVLRLQVGSVAHGMEIGMRVVLLDAGRSPLASTPRVVSHSGDMIGVRPVPPPAEVTALMSVVPLSDGITIQTVRADKLAIVELEGDSPFAVGDVITVADAPSQYAIVRPAPGDPRPKRVALSGPLPVRRGSLVVAVDWRAATTLAAVDAAHTHVTAGRAGVAVAGDIVAVAGTGDPWPVVGVASVAGRTLELASALDGAASLGTLVAGRFPRLYKVLAQDGVGTGVTVEGETGPQAGDCVARVAADGTLAGPGTVVQVVAAAGTSVVLAETPGVLAPGDLLSTVHWRVAAVAKRVLPPDRIEVDDATGLRAGDVTGLLTHYADCGNPGQVDTIAGDVLTLQPGLDQGDGIVAGGIIDGGIVGPAALSQPAPPRVASPAWQTRLRLETLDGIVPSSTATVHGLDLLTGQYRQHPVLVFVVNDGSTSVILYGKDNAAYRLRPETLALITRFNADFPAAFATFAQELQLVVRWMACQPDSEPANRAWPVQPAVDACGAVSPAPPEEKP